MRLTLFGTHHPRAVRAFMLLIGLGLVSVGCSPRKTSIKHVEVTGKVLNKNQPLPGGRVTFFSVEGGFSSSGNIDEKGNYKINAPVGKVHIAVDNRMLSSGRRGAPEKPKLKRPGAEDPQAVKGKFVSINSRYFEPDQSGLEFTVEDKSPQTYDIVLN